MSRKTEGAGKKWEGEGREKERGGGREREREERQASNKFPGMCALHHQIKFNTILFRLMAHECPTKHSVEGAYKQTEDCIFLRAMNSQIWKASHYLANTP